MLASLTTRFSLASWSGTEAFEGLDVIGLQGPAFARNNPQFTETEPLFAVFPTWDLSGQITSDNKAERGFRPALSRAFQCGEGIGTAEVLGQFQAWVADGLNDTQTVLGSNLIMPYDGYMMVDSAPITGTRTIKFELFQAAI